MWWEKRIQQQQDFCFLCVHVALINAYRSRSLFRKRRDRATGKKNTDKVFEGNELRHGEQRKQKDCNKKRESKLTAFSISCSFSFVVAGYSFIFSNATSEKIHIFNFKKWLGFLLISVCCWIFGAWLIKKKVFKKNKSFESKRNFNFSCLFRLQRNEEFSFFLFVHI